MLSYTHCLHVEVLHGQNGCVQEINHLVVDSWIISIVSWIQTLQDIACIVYYTSGEDYLPR